MLARRSEVFLIQVLHNRRDAGSWKHLSCFIKTLIFTVWVCLRAYSSFLSSGLSHQSKMTERSPWWKAFLPKKKTGAAKDSNQVFGPDFDPFAQQTKQKDPKPNQTHSQQGSNHSSLISDETYDDSQLDSMFNEQTCRRNMKVSRSGRFKVKVKPRSTLPIEEKERENAASGKRA